jgi:hypothetical protein
MPEVKTLGLAIRARWLGFAEIDDDGVLLDWGMIFYQRRNAHQLKSARARLEALITRMHPLCIARVRARLEVNEQLTSVRSLLRFLRGIASRESIEIKSVSRAELRATLLSGVLRNKNEIAFAVARIFPELAWRLPPERKLWTKEDSRMALFDAVAGALALQRKYADQFGEPSGRPLGDV